VNTAVSCDDELVLKKAVTPLYEGSKENILSATLFLVNLKILNCFSNTCVA